MPDSRYDMFATGGDPTPSPTSSVGDRLAHLSHDAQALASVLRGAWSVTVGFDHLGAVTVCIRVDSADWPANLPRLLAAAPGYADREPMRTDGRTYVVIPTRDGDIRCHVASLGSARAAV